ncbi:hypothetical protein BJV77DRAFT_98255 [Russula vinacea]|nr:hypothetical protein BJV77DRAFT_98255 [Russula vinacea]
MCPLLEAPVSNPSCLLSGNSPPTCVHFRQHTTFDRPLLCCGVFHPMPTIGSRIRLLE